MNGFETLEEALAYYVEFSGLILSREIETYVDYAEGLELSDWSLPTIQAIVYAVDSMFSELIEVPDTDYDEQDKNRVDHTVEGAPEEDPFRDNGNWIQIF